MRIKLGDGQIHQIVNKLSECWSLLIHWICRWCLAVLGYDTLPVLTVPFGNLPPLKLKITIKEKLVPKIWTDECDS